jgi:polyhydroxyalkanoate synthesis regulator phasin
MLDPTKMGNQMLAFYKTSFDNSFSAMMMLQEQMERMGSMYWGQMTNLPEEAQKGLNEWTKSSKKNCEEFKKVVDDSFKKLEAFFPDAEKAEKSKTA